jgi:hypothetical protein
MKNNTGRSVVAACHGSVRDARAGNRPSDGNVPQVILKQDMKDPWAAIFWQSACLHRFAIAIG